MLVNSLIQKLPRKFFLIFGGALLCLCISLFIHAPKAFADCGVNITGVNQWQGAIIVMDWQHGDGSGTTQANNTQVHIWSTGQTGNPPYNNEVVLGPGNAEAGSIPSNGSGEGGTFSQVGTSWAGTGGGCTSGEDQNHSSAVVLGYGNTSPCVSGCGSLNGAYNWALRCGTLEGNEQTFHYDGVGVPSGARSGGYWENAQGTQGNNGANDIIRLVYVEPPPPSNPPPVVGCTSLSVTTPTGSHVEYHVTITDSGGNTLIPSSSDDGIVHSANPAIQHTFAYTPRGQTVSYNIEQWTHHIVAPPGTDYWTDDGSVGSGSYGPCYSAECSLSINTDIPGGYVLAGQPYTVTATLYNDSPAQIYLPTSMSNASQFLEVQSNGGNFGFVSPGMAALNYGNSESVSFTMTFSSSGTLQGQAAYDGDFFMGSPCPPVPVNIYPPPLINTDSVVCNGDLSGWAFDPLATSTSISVDVWVDGPMGTGSHLGTFTADQPRPDVDAAYGITGNHGFVIPIPSNYQDGEDHTFYSYAIDPYGIENSGASTITMTGCESFHVAPGSSGAELLPSYEDPTSFGNTSPNTDSSVTVTYGTSNNPFYGPSSTSYPSYPGVPDSPYYYYTKNGALYGPSGGIPSPNGSGRFGVGGYPNETKYLAPSAPVTTIVAGDTYCLIAGVTPSDGFIDRNGNILPTPSTNPNPDTSSSCDIVQNRPFYKVYGSGAAAGGAFSSVDSSCTGGGELAGWNNDTGVSPASGDFGASAQFSALGLGDIIGFASGQTPNFGRWPAALSFANTNPADISSDTYNPDLGGHFGGTQCLTSEIAPANATSLPSNNISALPSGSYTVNGPVTLNAGQIAAGKNISIFVNGDVYITGGPDSGITYAGSSGSWKLNGNGSSNTPSFTLVVNKGDISIDPNIVELDGIYIAQPTTATSTDGEIFTCDPGAGPPPPSFTTSLYSNCKNQLTVYGSFVANQVKMLRTFGSLRDETPIAGSGGTPAGSQIGFQWTEGGGTTGIPGMKCTQVNEPAEPPSHTWNDNFLCVPAGSPVQLGWTWQAASGPTGNYVTNAQDQTGLPDCINLDPPGLGVDASAWTDNYLCSNTPGLSFNYSGVPSGATPISTRIGNPGGTTYVSAYKDTSTNQYCTQIYEDSDPDNNYIWEQTYLCEPLAASATPSSPATPATGTNCSNSAGAYQNLSLDPLTCAAEVFDFSPELYLSSPAVAQPNGGGPQPTAITSLPPVL